MTRSAWMAVTVALLLAIASATYYAHEQAGARRSSVLEKCEDTNRRNAATKAKLAELLLRVPPTERAQAKATKAFTEALIDTIAPHEDCARALTKAGF